MAGNASSRLYRIYPRNSVSATFLTGGLGTAAIGVAAGSFIDVPWPIPQNAYACFGGMLVGSTANRPSPGDPDFTNGLQTGFEYLDTTLGFIVRWNGVNWVNPATGASV